MRIVEFGMNHLHWKSIMNRSEQEEWLRRLEKLQTYPLIIPVDEAK